MSNTRRPTVSRPPCWNASFRRIWSRTDGRGDHDFDLRLRQQSGAGRRTRLLRHGQGRALFRAGRRIEPGTRSQPYWSRWGVQGLWAALLVLPRTYNVETHQYGQPLHSNLLDYVISATLIFYALTIAGVIRLRITRPGAERAVPGAGLSPGSDAIHSGAPRW